jgi:hypothetical protein
MREYIAATIRNCRAQKSYMVATARREIMLSIAGILAGSLYWNDQLLFGVTLSPSFTHCLGVADAPDRGVYVLLKKEAACPDLNKESLFDYVERKRIPSIAVIAWYDTIEEFEGASELAGAYCPKKRFIHKKSMSYGDVYYCHISQGQKTGLRGFFQLRKNMPKTEAVNIEFYLSENRKEYASEYWRLVESLVFSRH